MEQLSPPQVFNSMFERDEEPDGTYLCAGIRPKKSSIQTQVLVTPSKFAPHFLCKCAATGMRLVQNDSCCGCREGMAPHRVASSGNEFEVQCFSCFGRNCKPHECAPAINASTDLWKVSGCTPGHEGVLCAQCSSGYRSVGFSKCKKCEERDLELRVTGLVAASTIALLGLLVALWWFVLGGGMDKENTPAERGEREAEQLEQILLFLNYCQLLFAVLTTQKRMKENNLSEKSQQLEQLRLEEKPGMEQLKDIVNMNVGSILDAFSVQCLLGYQHGLNLEVLVSAFCLPSLCILALLFSCCVWKGKPFYGLKFATIATTALFAGSVQVIAGNLAWCESKDADGFDIGTQTFLHSRPYVFCQDADSQDPIRYLLYLALVLHVAVIPGGLLLIGSFIMGKTRGIQSLTAAFTPVIQYYSTSDPEPEQVTLQIVSKPLVTEALSLKDDKLLKYEALPQKLLCIHAAAYAACTAEAVESLKLEAMER